MAIAHLYGLKTEPRDAPRAPRMSVDPTDFAVIADLARSIAHCQTACIRLHDDTTGEVRLACFPPRPEISDLPETLLPDGCSNTRVTQATPSLQDEMRAAGMPDLAFWAGFAAEVAQRAGDWRAGPDGRGAARSDRRDDPAAEPVGGGAVGGDRLGGNRGAGAGAADAGRDCRCGRDRRRGGVAGTAGDCCAMHRGCCRRMPRRWRCGLRGLLI